MVEFFPVVDHCGGAVTVLLSGFVDGSECGGVQILSYRDVIKYEHVFSLMDDDGESLNSHVEKFFLIAAELGSGEVNRVHDLYKICSLFCKDTNC